MKTAGFVHLHNHTHYSLLDGATRIDDLCRRAKEMGQGAVAITDHGNMFGAIEFYNAALKHGIKPIIGCEMYMAPGDRREKDARGMKEASFHLLLLAQNLEGYHNLLKLCSIASIEGFYYRPRIDKNVLAEHSGGLICTSTCLGGEIPQALMRQDHVAAEEIAKTYLTIFGPDRFFIELQDHGLPEQKLTNPELKVIAKRLGAATIVTNDVHYLEHGDVEAHDVLCCISTGKLLTDEDRFKFPADQFYMKTTEEMAAIFPDTPESLENTVKLAGMCNVELDFTKRHAPVYHPPRELTPDEYLRELVYKGAREKYQTITPEITERIDYELEVIRSKGFSSYFLIVWDFVHHAQSRGIPCSARGSGCSAVISYCLGLSLPDPLRYGLYFERFMDPDRDEMPDIDIDICQEGRAEIIEYVRGKYGHVAQIITFNTLKPRAAVKDVARVMGINFERANQITKLIPNELKITIDKALDAEPELAQLYRSDPQITKVIDVARKLEGLARNVGVHAAGVVVADRPLPNFLPLYKPPAEDQIVVTQYDGNTVEKVGLLKMDFLGLRTLTILERARQLAQKRHGVKIDLNKLDLSDQKVYAIFATGDTKGIFQFESGGMREVLMKMKPNRIEDLIAANALFRPGPMVNIDTYVACKHGERWTTPHPAMTEVLAETYGIMVYQEQVSRVVNRLGGLELKRAFRLAKLISKKKTDQIDKEREPFIEGAVANGVARNVANDIFEEILRFGGYAFNKSHSTGYALVAFQTAYMKVYYPVEFMAATLTFEMGDAGKIGEYIEECRRMGIEIKPPDINESDQDFTVIPASDPRSLAFLRFGLGAIKGVGERAVTAIQKARSEGGPFKTIFDFCERVDLAAVNRGVIESLVNCGAFDCTGGMRKAISLVLDKAIEAGAARQKDRRSGQLSFFDMGDSFEECQAPSVRLGTEEWTEAEMLTRERAALGFFVTKNPLTSHLSTIRAYSTVSTVQLSTLPDGKEVVLGGMIAKLRTVVTKNGKFAGQRMGIVTIDDLQGQIEAVIFASDLDKYRAVVVPDAVVFLVGQVDRKREEPSIRVSDVIPIEQAKQRLASALLIKVDDHPDASSKLERLRAVIKAHSGDRPVLLNLGANGHRVCVRCGPAWNIAIGDSLLGEINALFGPAAAILGPDALGGQIPGASRQAERRAARR